MELQLLKSNYRGGSRMRTLLARCLFSLILCSAIPLSDAQVLYGTIVGAVTDPSGGAVPGASVTITNLQTNQTRSGTSNGEGEFVFTNVLAGDYKVTITASGFQSFTQQNVLVTINTVSRVNLKLTVGAVTESLTISAGAAALQTDTADVHV